MMKTQDNNKSISDLAALLLLGLFGVCILAVLLCGVKAYRDLTKRDQEAYASRTCAQYLVTKIRQAPNAQSVTLSDFGGGALVIGEELDGYLYTTRIYCHEGWLMELFAAADMEFAPEDGERVLEARDLSLRREGELLEVTVTHSTGVTDQLSFSLRGGEGAAYEE